MGKRRHSRINCVEVFFHLSALIIYILVFKLDIRPSEESVPTN